MTKTSKGSNAFDLTAFDGLQAAQDEGVPVEILHPGTFEPLGMTITVAGPDSIHAKNFDRTVINRRLKGRKTKALDAGEVQEAAVKKLAACTLSWTGVVDGGKVLECTRENALLVYNRLPFIAEQVAEAAGDRAVFIKS